MCRIETSKEGKEGFTIQGVTAVQIQTMKMNNWIIARKRERLKGLGVAHVKSHLNNEPLFRYLINNLNNITYLDKEGEGYIRYKLILSLTHTLSLSLFVRLVFITCIPI